MFGSGSRLLAWSPARLEPVGPVQTSARFGFGSGSWLEASSFLQMQPWLDASNPERVDLPRLGRCEFVLDLARGFSPSDRALVGGCQGLNHELERLSRRPWKKLLRCRRCLAVWETLKGDEARPGLAGSDLGSGQTWEVLGDAWVTTLRNYPY